MVTSDIEQAILAAPELSADRVAELTSRFVSIPSVNGQHSEAGLAGVIAAELDVAGFETALVGNPDRPSLGARGGSTGLVVLNGHLDTVPVDDAEHWRFDPFGGAIADGAVHGRGACDMKGGLAVQVAVAQWLASLGAADGLVLQFAMGEERGEPGTEDLIEAGFVAPRGVVLEPTDLDLGIAQRGMFTIRVTLTGRAGHASRPELTENPIVALPALLEVIEGLQADAVTSHPLLGGPRWTPTMIHSGVIPSMVPGTCVVHIDRRMVPGESVDAIIATLRSALADARLGGAAFDIDIAEEEGIYDPAEIEEDTPTVRWMREAIQSQGQDVRVFGTPYSSDIRHLINKAGVEAVTYGPGRAPQMHARDEHVPIAQLAVAARVVAGWCWRAMGTG